MSIERRRQRSDILREALTLQLRASAEREGLNALVLADDRGCVIARSSRDEGDAEEIAAHSPKLARFRAPGSPYRWVGTMRTGNGQRNVAITSFDVGEEQAYLCSVGLRSSKDIPELTETLTGVRRIMKLP